ncbi:hypothetical protein C0991_010418, partial [Blastosporella zonata]
IRKVQDQRKSAPRAKATKPLTPHLAEPDIDNAPFPWLLEVPLVVAAPFAEFVPVAAPLRVLLPLLPVDVDVLEEEDEVTGRLWTVPHDAAVLTEGEPGV